MPLDLDRVLLQRAGKLDAAARDIGVRGLGLQRRIGGNGFRRFCDGLAVGGHEAGLDRGACRARLSNRPRSTSRTSMRLRGEDMASRSLTRCGQPLGGQPHASLERDEVAPDVGRRLQRRHQRAAMAFERMNDHQVFGQVKLLHRQARRVDQPAVARCHAGRSTDPIGVGRKIVRWPRQTFRGPP